MKILIAAATEMEMDYLKKSFSNYKIIVKYRDTQIYFGKTGC